MANALAGFCAVLVLGALTVVISRGALPGEMLYSVKRASESVEMGLTSGDEARGRKNLDFASNRLGEISGLIERDSATAAGPRPAAAGLDPATATLVAGNLAAFDDQARTGSKLLLPLIGRSGGPPRGQLADWARAQSVRLGSLEPSLPVSQQASAADSRKLMDRLGDRASALDEHSSGCPDTAASGSHEDELGPLPLCGGADRTVAAPSSTPTTSSTKKTTTPRSTTEDPTTSTSDTSRSSEDPSSSSSRDRTSRAPATSATTPAPVNVPLPVPGLPPVSVPPLIPGVPGISLGG